MVKSPLLLGLGLVLAGIACNPEHSLDEVLKEKSCSGPELKCADGYRCDEAHICVPLSELHSGGTAGSASDDPSAAGAGGAPQEVATSGDPPVGGEGGAAGSTMAAAGAGAVSSDDPGDPDAGCVKQLIYIDRDGDGYGSAASGDSEVNCLKPGWVQTGGDCLDAVVTAENRANQVHPGQTEFFAQGYVMDPSGSVSFDYDCSKEEEPDTLDNLKAAGDCASATPPACIEGVGILPGDRSGPGVNNLCGSTNLQLCTPQGGTQQCTPEPAGTPGRAFKCR